ncbi:hypothetical protein [Paraburkholderia ferrariae]|uniref:hypothetical protein n=1 Tax=Paraburkholderia ferrariae TaxID=386056 RepID=UPI0012EB0DE8|nr:hypothetical protein [Paraburkholderia ferrariae]
MTQETSDYKGKITRASKFGASGGAKDGKRALRAAGIAGRIAGQSAGRKKARTRLFGLNPPFGGGWRRHAEVSSNTTTNEMNYTDPPGAAQGKLHYEIKNHNMKSHPLREVGEIFL